jgi:hypothetical protein
VLHFAKKDEKRQKRGARQKLKEKREARRRRK